MVILVYKEVYFGFKNELKFSVAAYAAVDAKTPWKSRVSSGLIRTVPDC